MEKIRRLEEQLSGLEAERATWDQDNREVRDYILPHFGFFSAEGDTANQGGHRGDKIVDGTASRSMRILAAGLHGGLTKPSTKWVRFGLKKKELMDRPGVREWLGEIEDVVFATLRASNFYQAMHGSVYYETPGFGTSVMVIEYDRENVVNFIPLTWGEYVLWGPTGKQPHTLMRRVWMPARQIYERFGERASRTVKDECSKGSKVALNRHEVIHCICPRLDRDRSKIDNKNMPWAEYYWEKGGRRFLSETGYRVKPFVAIRWDAHGTDIYGRGPGHDVLPDTKMLQQMDRTGLRALHKHVDPPTARPSNSATEELDTLPGGDNVYNSSQPNAIHAIYQTNPNLQHLDIRIARKQEDIKQALYVDMFLMIQQVDGNHQMTAREVSERAHEKLLMLGPIIERMTFEGLNPILDRVLDILQNMRPDLLPQMPEELEAVEIEYEYISMLAQAQKLQDLQTIEAITNFIAGLAKIQLEQGLPPSALDKLDFDEAIDEYHDNVGSPARLVRNDAIVEQIRQQRTEQQARERQMAEQQTAMEQMAGAAQTAKTMSETPVGGGNALDNLRANLEAL